MDTESTLQKILTAITKLEMAINGNGVKGLAERQGETEEKVEVMDHMIESIQANCAVQKIDYDYTKKINRKLTITMVSVVGVIVLYGMGMTPADIINLIKAIF